jgi:nucleoside 2-deoxyribosyltransferase
MNQRVYVAAPTEHAASADHFGSYLRTAIGAEIVSTWQTETDLEKSPRDPATRADKLARNLSQIDRATVFVCLTCGGRPVTTLCELGYAVARGIPVVWVHGAKDESALFDAHANVTVFITENPFRVVDRVAEWIQRREAA